MYSCWSVSSVRLYVQVPHSSRPVVARVFADCPAVFLRFVDSLKQISKCWVCRSTSRVLTWWSWRRSTGQSCWWCTPQSGGGSPHCYQENRVCVMTRCQIRVKIFSFSLISVSACNFFCWPIACSILMPPTFHIASLNRYTPKFSEVALKLT